MRILKEFALRTIGDQSDTTGVTMRKHSITCVTTRCRPRTSWGTTGARQIR